MEVCGTRRWNSLISHWTPISSTPCKESSVPIDYDVAWAPYEGLDNSGKSKKACPCRESNHKSSIFHTVSKFTTPVTLPQLQIWDTHEEY
jgi:hypothetical protein